ncbi:outer membrane beta-barrel family protein [Chryseobacterium vrystaatense]|uniref:Outer membrane receptor proteins, mostly Fe transport n=1 Tax=Chryseobacterium vrystaatense TaxID=307480 RepID=A0A1M5G9V2_9FLAO|nr:outer membrane beta-barrel family protein [Chryseobacterium vrystaatense]SHG00486.1 Outer membrane receptor proteins, mostly Fe transport [Chryseobacterium vrystaatense]
MKRKIYIFQFLFFCCTLFSQQFQLQGKIVDEKDTPLEYSEVLILKMDSIPVKSELSNEKGVFSTQLASGEYIIKIKYFKDIGYTKAISLHNNIDLGKIKIERTKNIKEIVLDGKKKLIERKIDRLIFNVENSISATGGDALDALKVTPGLKVQNEKISMVGKNGMSVMIDDRLIQLSGDDLTNFLRTIRSDEIKSIEVITNPPAKYDAEGNSGIVNIKRKKIASNSWKSLISSRYIQGNYVSGGMGASFDYQKNKSYFNFSVNYDRNKRKIDENFVNNYPSTLWEEVKTKKSLFYPLTTKLGFDYKLTPKVMTGVSFYYSYSDTNPTEKDRVVISSKTANKIDSLANSNKDLKNKYQFLSFNYHLNYEIDSLGKKLSFDFDYFSYQNKSNQLIQGQNFFPNSYPTPGSGFMFNSMGGINVDNYNFTLDMDHPIKSFTLNYGAKFSLSKSDSDNYFYNLRSGTPVLDRNNTNSFIYKEDISSVYASVTHKITSKLEGKLGLRLENVNTSGHSITLDQTQTNNYLKIYPTAYLSYTPNDDHSFNVNYGRRITRPRYFWFNPFRSFNNQYFYSEGNSFLQPAFSDNIELNYNFKNKVTAQFYYSHLKNGFDYVTLVQPGDLTSRYEKPYNYVSSDKYGVNISYTFDKFKWWESVNSLDYNYSHSTSSIPETNASLSGNSLQLYTTNTFKISSTIFLEASYFYSFPTVDGLFKVSSINGLDLAFKMFFMKKSLQLSVVGEDVFGSNRPTYTGYTNNIELKNKMYFDNQRFRISLIYKFGNNKLKTQQINSNNSEQKERVQ